MKIQRKNEITWWIVSEIVLKKWKNEKNKINKLIFDRIPQYCRMVYEMYMFVSYLW